MRAYFRACLRAFDVQNMFTTLTGELPSNLDRITNGMLLDQPEYRVAFYIESNV
jgi:hypothetical protein